MKIEIEIRDIVIRDLLIDAFGGPAIAYWAFMTDVEQPEPGTKRAPHLAVLDGGAVILACKDEATRTGRVTNGTILWAVQRMAKDHAAHFGNLVAGKVDRDTIDILIQLAVLGEHVYG